MWTWSWGVCEVEVRKLGWERLPLLHTVMLSHLRIQGLYSGIAATSSSSESLLV
jgi:hypothetical protein